MLKRVFQSDYIPYRTHADMPPTILGPILYNEWLLEPPRLYGESVAMIDSMLLRTDSNGAQTITIITWNNQCKWPSWSIQNYIFDAATGKFLQRVESNVGIFAIAWQAGIVQGFDGSLWTAELLDLVEVSQDFHRLRTIPSSFFGRIECPKALADKIRDIIIMPSEQYNNALEVYSLSTGVKIRTIPTMGMPKALCAEDDTRMYCLSYIFDLGKYLLELIDYSTGELISRIAAPSDFDGIEIDPYRTVMAWDRIYKRILMCSAAPDAIDGSSRIRVIGFYPISYPTYLSTPIPLKPVRKHKTIPITARIVGDCGEGLGSIQVSIESTDTNICTVNQNKVASDGIGYIMTTVNCKELGTLDINMSAEVL